MQTMVRLQREEFDVAVETATLTRGRTDIGALVTFTGICRGAESGEPIAALTLEHYPGMAEAEIARHQQRGAGHQPQGMSAIRHHSAASRPDGSRQRAAAASSASLASTQVFPVVPSTCFQNGARVFK